MDKSQKLVYNYIMGRKMSKADSNNKVITMGELKELIKLLGQKDDIVSDELSVLNIANYGIKTCTKSSPLKNILEKVIKDGNTIVELQSYFKDYDKSHLKRSHTVNKAQFIYGLRRQLARINNAFNEEVLILRLHKEGRDVLIKHSFLEIIPKKTDT